jgi:ribosome modulation factor
MAFSRAARKALRDRRAMRMQLRADPYYLGDEAWHFGAPEKANPFRSDTEEFCSWLKGWRDAEFETLNKLRDALMADGLP